MTFQSMFQVPLKHGDNEGVMFALPAQRLPKAVLSDVRRLYHVLVLAALLKQPLYLSMLGCGFSSRVLNRAKNHVLNNFVALRPTIVGEVSKLGVIGYGQIVLPR
ncbi:hypothetical protein [Micromonospora sp. HM5-17]|uniref:hypothetical protein n=1 Tax=Micromonospora sp. HM5-17 TaxID=2487710 RepID=UPI0011CE1A29|nr:hypothetical protein [Micromonospora sp. HM5-17]